MRFLASFLLAFFVFVTPVTAADPLPSWRPTEAKQRILTFVTAVTTPGHRDFVRRGDRVAVFDHDGTLIVEQPVYIEIVQVMDRLKEEAAKNPALKDQEPYKAALAGDVKALTAAGSSNLIALVAKTNAGMTSAEFQTAVQRWIENSRHPRFNTSYDRLTYRPMTELLDYLKRKGFKIFIVTGSNVDFVRAFAARLYGLPPEQIIGSLSKLDFVPRAERMELIRAPALDMMNDGVGKPVSIENRIGKRPVIAVGNSDGDYDMLKWTTDGKGPRLGALVHHDDAKREYQYDRDSQVGRLDRALDAAAANHWLVISMEKDWRRVFP